MDGHVADAWIGLFVVILTLLSVYILFALKVASQWEKAVVLRLGKFHALRQDLVSFGSSRSSDFNPFLD